MYKLLLSLCLVLPLYSRTANTSFISDKALRDSVVCSNDCEDDTYCQEISLHSKCRKNRCVCDNGRMYNGSCACVPCTKYSECYEYCCASGICSNEDCVALTGPNTNQDILLTATQIAMTGALIIGIITIIALLWKMCSKTDYRRTTARRRRPEGSRRSGESNASGGSLQRAVAERLRDAPPPYIRAPPLPPPGDTPPPYHLLPSQGYVNACFEGESNIPPPEYSIAITLPDNTQSSQTSEESQKAENEIQEPSNKEDKTSNNPPEASTVHI